MARWTKKRGQSHEEKRRYYAVHVITIYWRVVSVQRSLDARWGRVVIQPVKVSGLALSRGSG